MGGKKRTPDTTDRKCGGNEEKIWKKYKHPTNLFLYFFLYPLCTLAEFAINNRTNMNSLMFLYDYK